MDWIISHWQVLFSGIGGAVILFIIGLYVKNKTDRGIQQTGGQHNTAISAGRDAHLNINLKRNERYESLAQLRDAIKEVDYSHMYRTFVPEEVDGRSSTEKLAESFQKIGKNFEFCGKLYQVNKHLFDTDIRNELDGFIRNYHEFQMTLFTNPEEYTPTGLEKNRDKANNMLMSQVSNMLSFCIKLSEMIDEQMRRIINS